jgi:hypothetical protein
MPVMSENVEQRSSSKEAKAADANPGGTVRIKCIKRP